MDKLNIVETKEENDGKEILADAESLIKNTNVIENKPKTKKFIYFFVIPLLVLVILIAVLSTIFALVNIKNTNIINGIFIEGIDVSNLSKEQAKEKVSSVVNQPEAILPPVLFFIALDGIFTARVLLLTHDIDALTPRALLRTLKRRTA